MNDFDISRSLQNGADRFGELLPEIVGAILLVLIGWLLASLVQRLSLRALGRLNFDRAVQTSPAGNYIGRVVDSPTHLFAKVAYWIILLAFISFAISALDVPALNTIVLGVYSYIPNILAAILIFLVASAISISSAAFSQRVLGGGPLGKLVATVLPALTMAIAIFMILNQLKIAEDIVNITYSALMGSLALGMALAFGLGGRDVAARILSQAYDSTQAKSGEIKGELKKARSNARREAQRVRNKVRG